jgi:hypothetical protein
MELEWAKQTFEEKQKELEKMKQAIIRESTTMFI